MNAPLHHRDSESSYGAARSTREVGVAEGAADVSDVIESLGSRRFHLCHLAFQWLLACCGAGIVIPSPYVVPALQQEFHIGHATAVLVGSCVLVGAMLGVLLLGPIIDRSGRRAVLVTVIPLSGCLGMCHVALPKGPGVAPLLLLFGLRTALGVCFGGIVLISVPYLLEFLDSDLRGAWVSAANLGWTWGTVFVLMVAWTFEDDWRVVLTVCCLPALPALVMVVLWAPESPRWLYVVGRDSEGLEVLDRMSASPPLDLSFLFGKACKPRRPEYRRPENVFVQRNPDGGKGPQGAAADVRELLGPRFRQALLAAILVAVAAASASHASMFALPVILKKFLGADSFHYGLFIGNEVAGLVGLITVAFLLDPIGRRPFLIGIYCFCTVFMLMYLVVPKTELFLFSLSLIFGAVWSGIWPAYGAYAAEAFPTRLRGTANGFIVFCARLSASVSPIMVGWLLDAEIESETAAIVFIASLLMLGVLGGVIIPRETAREKVLDT